MKRIDPEERKVPHAAAGARGCAGRHFEVYVEHAGNGDNMEKVTETWVTVPERPVSMTNRNACLVHIYPTGPGMGSRYTLADAPLVIGRGSDCDIRINDHSVS